MAHERECFVVGASQIWTAPAPTTTVSSSSKPKMNDCAWQSNKQNGHGWSNDSWCACRLPDSLLGECKKTSRECFVPARQTDSNIWRRLMRMRCRRVAKRSWPLSIFRFLFCAIRAILIVENAPMPMRRFTFFREHTIHWTCARIYDTRSNDIHLCQWESDRSIHSCYGISGSIDDYGRTNDTEDDDHKFRLLEQKQKMHQLILTIFLLYPTVAQVGIMHSILWFVGFITACGTSGIFFSVSSPDLLRWIAHASHCPPITLNINWNTPSFLFFFLWVMINDCIQCPHRYRSKRSYNTQYESTTEINKTTVHRIC